MLILQMLAQGHRVDIFTYANGVVEMQDYFKKHRTYGKQVKIYDIPGLTLEFHGAKLSLFKTVTGNVKHFIAWQKTYAKQVAAIIRQEQYALFVIDFEFFFSRLAHKLHGHALQVQISSSQAAIAHGTLGLPADLKKRYLTAFNRMFVRMYQPRPDKAFITSFYRPETLNSYAQFMGPVLRSEVLDAKRVDKKFILTYIKPTIEDQVFPVVEELAQQEKRPFVVYVNDPGKYHARTLTKYIRLKKTSLSGDFLKDLINCTAVIGTAGIELPSEAIYLEKPMFGIIESGQWEQGINGYYIEKVGLGLSAESDTMTVEILSKFLDAIPQFKKSVLRYKNQMPIGSLTIPKILASYLPKNKKRK